MTDDSNDRIARLEMRFTEQEAVIEDLNAAITAQWRTIDALKRRIEALAEQIAEASAVAPGAVERPPPHY